MVMRALNVVMALLFALAVAVQYNDPDPLRWVLIYGAASGLAAHAALKGRAPAIPCGVIAAVALAWGLYLGSGVFGQVSPARMFDAWEMKSPLIEEEREATGLLIVAAWMTTLALQSRGRVVRR